MSVEAMAWAWKVDANLKTHEKFILVRLADHANADGVCWPGKDSLADTCCCSKRSVDRAIERLEALGLITVEHRTSDGGKQRSNRYFLNLQQRPLFGAVGVSDRQGCQTDRGARGAGVGVSASQKRGVPRTPEPSLEPSVEPSVSNETEPAAQEVWKKVEKTGVARSVIGKWIRDHGEVETRECIEHLVEKQPADPVQYGAAWLQHRLRLPSNDNELESFVRKHGLPTAKRDDTYASWRARLRQAVKEINQQGRAPA